MKSYLLYLLLPVSYLLISPETFAQALPEISESIKKSIQARVDNGENQSIIVGITDGKEVRYYQYGQLSADMERSPDEHTLFEIGSITKVYTCLLLSDMVEKGEVQLDEPLEDLLPEGVKAPQFNGKSITLRHLATHTSSLPRMPGNFNGADTDNPYVSYSADQLWKYLSKASLYREIGSEYQYSNLGMGLLGQLLADKNGMTYGEVIRRRICEVLDLQETVLTLDEAQKERLAPGHSGSMVVSNWDFEALAGAGALRASASDLLKFLSCNMGVKESAMYPAMQRTHQSQGPAGGGNMEIGLGWHIAKRENGDLIWHNGGTGGYRSFAGFSHDGKLGAVVLTNSDVGVDDLGFHLLDKSFPLRETTGLVQVDEAILEEYTGTYIIQPGAVFTITRDGAHLFAQLTGQPSIEVYPKSESRFFYRVVKAELEFYRDEEGKVESLTLFQNGLEIKAGKKKD